MYLFHNASLALAKGDVTARLVFDVLDLDLATACLFGLVVLTVAFFVVVAVVQAGRGRVPFGVHGGVLLLVVLLLLLHVAIWQSSIRVVIH